MLTFIVSSGQPPPVTHVPLPIVPLYSTYKLFPHIPLPIVHLHSTNKLFPHINVILFNDWEVCLTERLSCECNIMLVQDRSILPNEHHSRCNFRIHQRTPDGEHICRTTPNSLRWGRCCRYGQVLNSQLSTNRVYGFICIFHHPKGS